MSATPSSATHVVDLDPKEEEEEEEEEEDEDEEFLKQLVSRLPREDNPWLGKYIYQYQGFWYSTENLKGVVSLQKYFQAQPDDILLASYPKSGTTWLKALIFSIVNHHQNEEENPLLKANPHELVTFLEVYAYKNPKDPRPRTNTTNVSPLIVSTHMPYTSLPDSVKMSGCRIVYVFRDPKDVLVSAWHFMLKIMEKNQGLQQITLEEVFEQFARGVSPYGPYWDHVIGYWEASLKYPDKVLLLSYEDLKENPCLHVKRLADFLGYGFSKESEEEEEGKVINKIIDLCSFENLKNLEVNKSGTRVALRKIENKFFFREGKVGDAKNHLSEEMMKILDQITENKFKNMINLRTKYLITPTAQQH